MSVTGLPSAARRRVQLGDAAPRGDGCGERGLATERPVLAVEFRQRAVPYQFEDARRPGSRIAEKITSK